MGRVSSTLDVVTSGIVAGISNIDACAIISLLFVSSVYGFSILWALVLGLLIYAAVLQLAVELTLATGKGFAENLKGSARTSELSLIVVSMVAANLSLLSAQVGGMAVSLASLFNVPLTTAILASAALVFVASSLKPCNLVDKVLVSMCLVAFLAVALRTPPEPLSVVAGIIAPDLSIEPGYWVAVMAVMGISMGPNVILFEASDLIERGVRGESLLKALASVLIGTIASLAIALAIMGYGRALSLAHEDLAAAIEGSVHSFGRAFTTIFLLGLLASSTLASIVTHQSTVALLSEVYGWRGAGSRRSAKAWVAWTGAITIISTLPVLLVPKLVKISLVAAVINGIAAIPVLVYLIKLCTRPSLMGGVEIGRAMRAILQVAVGAFIAINVGSLLIIMVERPLLGYVTLPADLLILAIGAPLAMAVRRLSLIRRGGR